MRLLGRELPVNTLDELIDQLGGPECVAEVSAKGQQTCARRPPAPPPALPSTATGRLACWWVLLP